MQLIKGNTLDNLHQEVPGNYYTQAIEKNLIQRFWHNRRFKEVKKFLISIKAKNILDIGCHGGIFTDKLYQQFRKSKIHGIDISKEAILFANRTYHNIQFQVSRAEKLPFRKNTFDLVSCFEMLEHVERPQSVIKEVSRVLKKNGYFISMVPTENFIFRVIWSIWSKIGPGRVWKHTHIQKFQNDKLNKSLPKNDFVIIKRKLFLFGMLLIILAKRK